LIIEERHKQHEMEGKEITVPAKLQHSATLHCHMLLYSAAIRVAEYGNHHIRTSIRDTGRTLDLPF
jgi:hypothetical protein